jgi:aryl-alcohol dehydrogenase-like predicted oxidoreductase
MNYRRLGRSGLQVSELSIGSWVTYGNQVDTHAARESLAAARDAGVNFFDNAEVYAGGKSEEIMGQALKELAWPRLSYVVSTKFFWGLQEAPNQYHTLNRKYLLNAIDASLKRLQLDYVDLVFCHRPDPNTPVEETVWAMRRSTGAPPNGARTRSVRPTTSRNGITFINLSWNSHSTTCSTASASSRSTSGFTRTSALG